MLIIWSIILPCIGGGGNRSCDLQNNRHSATTWATADIHKMLHLFHLLGVVATVQAKWMNVCLLLQSTLAEWVKWPQHASAPLLNGTLRQHGSVCHQDPRWLKLSLCDYSPAVLMKYSSIVKIIIQLRGTACWQSFQYFTDIIWRHMWTVSVTLIKRRIV